MGERGGYGKEAGAVRRRERERERGGPEAVKGRTPGGREAEEEEGGQG